MNNRKDLKNIPGLTTPSQYIKPKTVYTDPSNTKLLGSGGIKITDTSIIAASPKSTNTETIWWTEDGTPGNVVIFNKADSSITAEIANPNVAGDMEDLFGTSLAVDSTTGKMYVSAPYESPALGGYHSGAVYSFDSNYNVSNVLSNIDPDVPYTDGDSGYYGWAVATTDAFTAVSSLWSWVDDIYGEVIVYNNVDGSERFRLSPPRFVDAGINYVERDEDGQWFGYDIAMDDRYIIVSSIYDSYGVDQYEAGIVYVFDIQTGDFLYSVDARTNETADGWHEGTFGWKVDISENYLVVSDPIQVNNYLYDGYVAVYDIHTGGHIRTITHKSDFWHDTMSLNEDVGGDGGFGYAIAVNDNYLAVTTYGWFDRDIDELQQGWAETGTMVEVFNVQTGELIYRYDDPRKLVWNDGAYQTYPVFGANLVMDDTKLYIGAPDYGWGYVEPGDVLFPGYPAFVYIVNLSTGEIEHTIEHVTESTLAYQNMFGYDLDVTDDHIIVSAPQHYVNDVEIGSLFVYDKSTYELVDRFDRPGDPVTGEIIEETWFGRSVSASNLYVSAGDPNGWSWSDYRYNAAFIFNKASTEVFEATSSADEKYITRTVIESIWEISDDPLFNNVISRDIRTDELQVDYSSPLALNPTQNNYVRVKYRASNGMSSDWSESVPFTNVVPPAPTFNNSIIKHVDNRIEVEHPNKENLQSQQISNRVGSNVKVSDNYMLATSRNEVGVHTIEVYDRTSNNYLYSISAEDQTGYAPSGDPQCSSFEYLNSFEIIENPNAYSTGGSDYFGYSTSASGDYVASGAYLEDDSGGTSSGKVYIHKISTRELIATINNPNTNSTSAGDYFGYSLSMSGHYLAVGAYNEDPAAGVNAGVVHVFKTDTGNWDDVYKHYTIADPNMYSTGSSDYFGYAVATDGIALVVGAPYEDQGGSASGSAYVFDVESSALIYSIARPYGYTNAKFGDVVDVSYPYAIIGGPGSNQVSGAFVFDITTGLEHFRYEGWRDDGTGNSVAISEKYALIADTTTDYVTVFDVITGKYLYRLIGPQFDSYGSVKFGSAMEINGNHALISSGSGEVYIYNLDTGDFLRGFSNDATKLTDRVSYVGGFGGQKDSVTLTDNAVILGGYASTVDGYSSSGVIVVYDFETHKAEENFGFDANLINSSDKGLISVSDRYIFVGEPQKSEVYVFDTATGNYTTTLSTPSGQTDDKFGHAVHQTEKYLYVGAPHFDGTGDLDYNTGVVYVYSLDTLTLAHTINNPNYSGRIYNHLHQHIGVDGDTTNARIAGVENDRFGWAIAADEFNVVISAISESGPMTFQQSYADYAENWLNTTQQGRVYIFDVDTFNVKRTIDPTVELLYVHYGTLGFFGYTLALHNDTLAIGAPFSAAGYSEPTGSVYLYNVTTGNRVHTLEPSLLMGGAQYGQNVELNDNYIVVSCPNEYNSQFDGLWFMGKVYVYDRNTYRLLTTLKASDSAKVDSVLGKGVALYGTEIYVSDPGYTIYENQKYTTGIVYKCNIEESTELVAHAFSSNTGLFHTSSDWQIATDSNFTNIVYDMQNDTRHLWKYMPTVEKNNSTYYARVRYNLESKLYTSTLTTEWSNAVTFNNRGIDTPEFKFVSGTNTVADNVVTISAFSAEQGITYTATDWQVATDDTFTTVLEESLDDNANIVEYTISGTTITALNGTNGYIRVRYKGLSSTGVIVYSDWSDSKLIKSPLIYKDQRRPILQSLILPDEYTALGMSAQDAFDEWCAMNSTHAMYVVEDYPNFTVAETGITYSTMTFIQIVDVDTGAKVAQILHPAYLSDNPPGSTVSQLVGKYDTTFKFTDTHLIVNWGVNWYHTEHNDIMDYDMSNIAAGCCVYDATTFNFLYNLPVAKHDLAYTYTWHPGIPAANEKYLILVVENFKFPISPDEHNNHTIFGVYNEHPILVVYDITNGNFIRTIQVPDDAMSWGFGGLSAGYNSNGQNVVLYGDNLFVGNPNQPGVYDYYEQGCAWHINVATGEVINRYDFPGLLDNITQTTTVTSTYQTNFGAGVATNGKYVAISSPGTVTFYGDSWGNAGMISVFDVESSELIYKFRPEKQNYHRYGYMGQVMFSTQDHFYTNIWDANNELLIAVNWETGEIEFTLDAQVDGVEQYSYSAMYQAFDVNETGIAASGGDGLALYRFTDNKDNINIDQTKMAARLGETTVEIQIATDIDFTNVIETHSDLNSVANWTPNNRLPKTTYYGRSRSIVNGITSDWSEPVDVSLSYSASSEYKGQPLTPFANMYAPPMYGSTNYNRFGYATDVDNKYAISSAPYIDTAIGNETGGVTIFNLETKQYDHIITNPDPLATDMSFGIDVAISGSTAVVSSLKADESKGNVYIIDADTGSISHTLSNPNLFDEDLFDSFGYSVDIDGNRVIVGAPAEDDSIENSGAVYIFDSVSGSRTRTIRNPYRTSNSNFGHSVAIHGTKAIIGSPGSNITQYDTYTGTSLQFGEQDLSGIYNAYRRVKALPNLLAGSAFSITTNRTWWWWRHNNRATVDKIAFEPTNVNLLTNVIVDEHRDDSVFNINCPFGVTYLGTTYSSIKVSSNSLLMFGYRNASYDGYEFSERLPYCPKLFIAANDNSVQRILEGTIGPVGSRTHIVRFEGTCGTSSFIPEKLIWEVRFYENNRARIDLHVIQNDSFAVLPENITTGAAFVFDVTTGELLQTLKNPDSFFADGYSDRFGHSVDIYGDYAIVGAPGDSQLAYRYNEMFYNRGAAYIFNIVTGELVEPYKMLASFYNGDVEDTSDFTPRFGESVGINGKFAIVSQPGAKNDYDTGAYVGEVYVIDLETTKVVQKYTMPDQPIDRYWNHTFFGESVALSPTHAIVGLPSANDGSASYNAGDNLHRGQAIVYEVKDNWLEAGHTSIENIDKRSTQYPDYTFIKHYYEDMSRYSRDTYYSSGIGQRVAIGNWHHATAGIIYRGYSTVQIYSNDTFELKGVGHVGEVESMTYIDDTVVIGHRTDNVGTVDILHESGTVLHSIAEPTVDSRFGYSLNYDGTHTFVGAPLDSTDAASAGKVYQYTITPSNSSYVRTLSSPTPQAQGLFGHDIATNNTSVFVSALDEEVSNNAGNIVLGKVYAFNKSTGAYDFVINNPTPNTVLTNHGYNYDMFGYSIDANDTYIAIGAPGEERTSTYITDGGYVENSGAVFVYTVDGILQYTLQIPNSYYKTLSLRPDYFGHMVKIYDNKLYVSAPFSLKISGSNGTIFVFDLATQEYLGLIESPFSDNADGQSSTSYCNSIFGHNFDIHNNIMFVGSTSNPSETYIQPTSDNIAYGRNNPFPRSTWVANLNKLVEYNMPVRTVTTPNTAKHVEGMTFAEEMLFPEITFPSMYVIGIETNDDGTILTVVCANTAGAYGRKTQLYKYSLSTPYDMSTATLVSSTNGGVTDKLPVSLTPNKNGTAWKGVFAGDSSIYHLNGTGNEWEIAYWSWSGYGFSSGVTDVVIPWATGIGFSAHINNKIEVFNTISWAAPTRYSYYYNDASSYRLGVRHNVPVTQFSKHKFVNGDTAIIASTDDGIVKYYPLRLTSVASTFFGPAAVNDTFTATELTGTVGAFHAARDGSHVFIYDTANGKILRYTK